MRILDEAAGYKVALISAPAGYGKTFALSEWAQARSDRIAWVSLEASDDDPVRLYYYFKKILRRFSASVEDDDDFLSSFPVQSITTNLTLMLNSLDETTLPFFIVLDDYHHIQNWQSHRILEFLIQYLPESIHLIVSTRLDPPIALDRMRIENLLYEIRADALSFTSDETKRYLNGNLNLSLTDKVIANLAAKTEGWIAGVQIAALLLRNRSDSTEVIDNYSGNHTHVMAYFVREAYFSQPKHIQTFLLNSSILDHLSPGICNAVMSGQHTADSTLKYLIANNLFISQVDQRRNWYRYHNLFSEALRNLLRQYNADLIPTLYHRASCWYEQNGYAEEAIRYALLAEDVPRAVTMIVNYAATALKLGERFIVRKWLEELSQDMLDERPVLGVLYAWTLMNDKTAAADEMFNHWLGRAEKTITAWENDRQEPGAASHLFSRQALMETITLLRAIFVFEREMPSKLFVEKLQQAAGLHNSELKEFRCITLYLTGRIQLRAMDYKAALCTLDEAIPTAKLSGYYFLEVYTTYLKAWILFQQGKYHQAVHLCESTLDALVRSGRAKRYGTTMIQALNIIIGAVYLERHCLEEALDCLERALASLRRSTEIGLVAHGLIHLALVKIAMNKKASDIKSILSELEILGRYHHLIVPLADAVQMKLSMQLGDYPLELNSQKMAQLLQLSDNIPGKELTYYQNLDWRLTRTLLSIQIYMKCHLRPGKTMRSDIRNLIHKYLAHQLEIVEALGLNRLKIEILVTLADLAADSNDSTKELHYLEKALDLAAPQEAVMPFIEHGARIIPALKQILQQQRYTTFINTILSRLSAQASVLIDSLSQREEEVLQLIAQGFSNHGISTSLNISINTTKTHISSIYSKLGVNKRTRAVSRAKEIGIL